MRMKEKRKRKKEDNAPERTALESLVAIYILDAINEHVAILVDYYRTRAIQLRKIRAKQVFLSTCYPSILSIEWSET